jgi:hypothetical protein
MSNPVNPPQPTSSAAQRQRPASEAGSPGLRQADWPGADLRAGDAERAEMADRLSKHFSDGRLDEAEFSERMDRAMRAKTMADLSGLLSDLPATESGPVPPGGRRQQRQILRVQLQRERLQLKHEQRAHRRAERRQRWRALRWLPLFVGILVGAVMLTRMLSHSIAAWLVIGVIAMLWLRRTDAAHSRRTGSGQGLRDLRDGDENATSSRLGGTDHWPVPSREPASGKHGW